MTHGANPFGVTRLRTRTLIAHRLNHSAECLLTATDLVSTPLAGAIGHANALAGTGCHVESRREGRGPQGGVAKGWVADDMGQRHSSPHCSSRLPCCGRLWMGCAARTSLRLWLYTSCAVALGRTTYCCQAASYETLRAAHESSRSGDLSQRTCIARD